MSNLDLEIKKALNSKIDFSHLHSVCMIVLTVQPLSAKSWDHFVSTKNVVMSPITNHSKRKNPSII